MMEMPAMGSPESLIMLGLGPLIGYWFIMKMYIKFVTFRAHSPLPLVAKLFSPFVRAYKYGEEDFYGTDGAPAEIQEMRKKGLDALQKQFDALTGPKAEELNEQLRGLSDIRFTDTNRVPHSFQPVIRSRLRLGFIATKSEGCSIIDVDGNKALDVSGSYGVNVVGYQKYKQFVTEGIKKTGELGPNVLGPLHPCIFDVLKHLTKISGQDEVSFHMSGTEAVMCAVRLARFNTGKKLIVQFAGAYHGWWDGVQTGVGNERAVPDSLTLKDMTPAALACIRARKHEIAAVLVSPLQGLNPGAPPPNDLTLMDAKVRSTADKDDKYKVWLDTLQALCNECGIPLVFDEVYTGFRMAVGGAQEYYSVKADMIVYGKTLGGGMPVGVVCGRKDLMARFDPEKPMRVAYVIGTFAAAPMTLGPMGAFLDWVTTDEAREAYRMGTKRTSDWVLDTNEKFVAAGYPIRVDHLTTVWTVLFTRPGRYHWMFQYYMRAEGLALSWVGTGRCLFSLDFTDKDYAEVQTKLLAACEKMTAAGWWWDGVTAKVIKNAIVSEFLTAMFVPSFLKKKVA